jgi:hypothetical protein
MEKDKETFCHQDGVTLREYFCQRMDDMDEKIKLRFDMQALAISKAEKETDIKIKAIKTNGENKIALIFSVISMLVTLGKIVGLF